MKNKFYITTPLYYVNAKPHIGHAYTNIASDCIARYQRLRGFEVFFLTGTDEHGQKVAQAAEAAKLTPLAFADNIVLRFKHLWKKLDISYDDFIRTTQKRHCDTVQEVLTVLWDKKDIYLGRYEGFYCTPCETFWSDMQIKNKLCPDCQRSVEKISEENYFLKMSKYQSWLIRHINSHPEFILPVSRRKEILSFLQEPLTDLCVSRPKQRLSWGIPLPFSTEHVSYVWFDALVNYISAPGYCTNQKNFKKLWPVDIQLIGKDILRHHAVYWPIMLHALGLKPPKTIFAHGWWMAKDVKMSKSRGNIVNPQDVVSVYGVDVFRYFLLREVPFGLDGIYSEKALVGRLNSDLANDLGNLLHRSLTMIEKYFGAIIPKPVKSQELSQALICEAGALPEKYFQAMERIEFGLALDPIWALINSANKYIEESKPWIMSKNGETKKLATVVYDLAEVLRLTAVLIYPFMPETAMNMLRQLGAEVDLTRMHFKELLKWGLTLPGAKINKAKPLFPRII